MKVVLNVAEKPSVAKEIVRFLSNDQSTKFISASKYNPIYEFFYTLKNEQVKMRVTSVTGHIMGMEFREPYNKWNLVTPDELFSAPIQKAVSKDKTDVVSTLKFASRDINILALWLDCDREGENIAYEVIQMVQQVTTLPNTCILRAHFSALTYSDITNAIQNLTYPKIELSEAVDARQEIDLRLGAAFTRLQTTKLRTESYALTKSLISWGPCQFPTLGFVVKRFLEIKNFVSEKYWSLDLIVQKGNGKNAKFVWNREKVFDYLVGLVLYEKALSETECTITQVTKKQKLKYRPVPLSTIEYTKLASSKLRISSENAMAIAEKLYQKGFISYPRTETDSFKTSINLRQLVELHRSNPVWGSYVETMTQGNFNWPRNGGHDDNSHPPIHPVKSVTNSELTGDEWRVYELITRRFLACCSQDAKGYETRVEAAMGEETFHCKGIEITEENFLQIYVYMKWNEAELPNFEQGEKITPSSFLMNEHNTQPPSLLTESDLIAAMDNSGIGTDATIHQHIKTIQDRNYAEKTPNGLFKPTSLGLALVQGYSSIGATLHQPELRAKMEKEMNGIVNKTKVKDQVIQGILQEMKDVFTSVKRDFQVIAKIVRDTVGNEGFQSRSEVSCFKCGKQGHSASQCDVLQRDESKINGNEDKQEKTVICYKCKKPGHWANQCGVTPVVAEPGKVVCYKCGKEGHYATYCNGRVLTNNNKSEDQPIRTNDQDKKISEKKVCPKCGHLGRHPKGSECLKRKKN